MLSIFKKEKNPTKKISKIWDQFIAQINKSGAPIESVKSDGENVFVKFFKNSEEKFFDKKVILTLLAYVTIIVAVSIVVFQMNSEAARIDKFHRDIIGRCIDKGWEVSLYKDGQLESCHIPRTLE